jgi:serine/threonine-protein kinase
MRFGTRVWGIGKVLLLIGGLCATFLVFFGMSMRVALRSREVQVPQLVGRTVNDATQILVDEGLGLRVDQNRRADDKVPAGRITQQDPPAGVQTRQQRTVRVWVSSGPRTTVVPELVGQTERTARLRVEQDGLQVSSVSELRSTDYPADAIVAQDPPASTRAPAVALLINRGEQSQSYVMPDVIGMDGERVAGMLRGRGFRVAIVGSQPYPDVPPGTIVRQQPAGGFQISPSDAISLEVSR